MPMERQGTLIKKTKSLIFGVKEGALVYFGVKCRENELDRGESWKNSPTLKLKFHLSMATWQFY
jgi:hypothetical protein